TNPRSALKASSCRRKKNLCGCSTRRCGTAPTPDFSFRGSLGPTLVGHDQFAGYVDMVTGALAHYITDILALIEERDRVGGKMRFHGIHRAELFGVPPSGRHVWWIGMPIFTFAGGKVRDLYVLGDIHGLIARLKGEVAGASPATFT